MATAPDWYARLGVSEAATAEEIKKRYRELARTYHPDVNPGDAGAARRFAEVADAYRVLSDPDRRRIYDAERAVAARAAARRAGATAPTAPPRAQSGPATPPSPRPSTPSQVEAERFLEAARTAFRQGRVSEARMHATRAVAYHGRNPAAHELLGDIHRQQGRIDDAFKHYTLCLQLDPRNGRVSERLDRLAREARWRQTRESGGGVARGRRPLALLLVNYFGYGSAGILSVIAAMAKVPYPETLSLGFIHSWTGLHVGLMVASGVLLGATQSIASTVRRVEDDFLFGGGGRGGSPVGLLVLILGAVQFHAAALLHLISSLYQETMHRSLAWTYGTVFFATCAYAFGNDAATADTLLWGGNVVFVSHFAGRLLGDFFRSD